MADEATIYRPSPAHGALRQGEVLSDLLQLKLQIGSIGSSRRPTLDVVSHPYAIVMSQDCDLEQDHRARESEDADDKLIPNVLFCEVVEAEALRRQDGINSSIWARLKTNKDERYQFLQRADSASDAIGRGLPELALDFKRYFTLPTDELYVRLDTGAKRRCSLVSPYLEHLSSRFCSFQARVALPADHFSEPKSGT